MKRIPTNSSLSDPEWFRMHFCLTFNL